MDGKTKLLDGVDPQTSADFDGQYLTLVEVGGSLDAVSFLLDDPRRVALFCDWLQRQSTLHFGEVSAGDLREVPYDD